MIKDVFVQGETEITVDANELYGDVQITGGGIEGTFSVTASISDDLKWEYDGDDITDMLDDQGEELDFLWYWLELKGVKVWAEFLTYLINDTALDLGDTIILRDILLKHQHDLQLFRDALGIKGKDGKEKEEKDEAKV